jgi:hypothetical protein
MAKPRKPSRNARKGTTEKKVPNHGVRKVVVHVDRALNRPSGNGG